MRLINRIQYTVILSANTMAVTVFSAENHVHVHDSHATILHMTGLDREQLAYGYGLNIP